MKFFLSLFFVSFSFSSFAGFEIEEVECARELSSISCDVNKRFQMQVIGRCWVEGSFDLKDGLTVTDEIYTTVSRRLENDPAGIYHINKMKKGSAAKSKARKRLSKAIKDLPVC